MKHSHVIIIGGGPAGSACARRLQQNKIDCLVLDQDAFPRLKPCAGWITPEVLHDLEIEPIDYPHSITTFLALHYTIRKLHFRLPTRQYAIRRYEFDDWLLQRSGAPVQVHTVRKITRTPQGFEIDGAYSCQYLIGAGGTHCPVYRTFFKQVSPRAKKDLIVTLEEEFPYEWQDNRCQLWFMQENLPGYAWYVPKARGYVNVGIGGKAEQLNQRGDSIKTHWDRLVQTLDDKGLVRMRDYTPLAHTYYTRQRLPEVHREGAFLTGDAAGLATLEMGEGIGPAIRSGLLAADSIIHKRAFSLDSIPRYSLRSLIRLGLS